MRKFVFGAAFALLGGVAFAGPYEDGMTAFDARNYEAAFAAWKPLADAGDAKAQLAIGILYDQGWGVAMDRAEAAKWYTVAAEKGDARAAFNLGQLYSRGEGVAVDGNAAVRWYVQAGSAGDAIAGFELGLILAEGKIVPQNFAEAARWYTVASDQKHSDAMFRLGNLYAMGQGVEQDLDKATELFEKADVALMSGSNVTACTPVSVAKISECRRKVPHT